MRFKRLLALLLAAALALAVLVGCGSGQQSAAQALLKLLDGKYPNISIEIDPDLEADLRQAISQAEAENAGDDDAVIRAALEKLVGSTVTFRNLGEGQQGDTTFDLIFYAGTDPDKAAQTAYSQWNLVFSNVPDDGQYDTSLAMVETNSGVWMLVKATVEKAGTVDKPDKDDDEPETQEPPEQEKGYTEVTDSNGNVTGYTVNTKDGLQNLFEDKWSNARSATITLTTNQTVTGTFGDSSHPFTGTLQSEAGKQVTITLSSESGQPRTQGLFNEIGIGGTVQDVDIQVTGTISNPGGTIGAVAGTNYGTIENCDVTDGTIESTNKGDVGGIVGYNYGTIKSCSSAAAVKNGQNTGGIAGSNSGKSGTITDCCSTGTVTSGNSYSNTGGVVGDNNGATITACYSTGNITSSGEYSSYAGGVAGDNMFNSDFGGGKITACFSTGKVSGTTVGGVVGWNSTSSIVTACYWSGQVSSGYGIGYNQIDGNYTNDNATQVTGGVTWQTAYKDMKTYTNLWVYKDPNTPPKLKWEK